MKKTSSFLLLSIVLVFISCGSKNPVHAALSGKDNDLEITFDPEPVPTGDFKILMDRLHNPADSTVMVCAHRGVSEIFPENSIPNINECIRLGFEIVEIDMRKTKDGKIILMHDATLDRTTTGSGKVSDFTLDEINKLYLKDINGNITTYKVPTLEEALDVAKGNILLQIDKWNGLTNEILPIIKNKQCLQQCIFRSTLPYETIKTTFNEYLPKILYIPVIPAGREEANHVLESYLSDMSEIPVMCIVFPNENNPMLTRVPELKKKYRIWFNALADSDSGSHGDKQAETDPDGSWGWLVQKGANIIFTDKPIKLDQYLKSKNWR